MLGEKGLSLDLDKKEIVTSKNKISFEYVIGADGAQGITARSLKRKPLTYAFGMEAEVETASINDDYNSITLNVGLQRMVMHGDFLKVVERYWVLHSHMTRTFNIRHMQRVYFQKNQW